MRTSTSFATLVAFMAVAGSAAPIGVVGPSNCAVARACVHQHTRDVVLEGHSTSVKDMDVVVVSEATKRNGDNTLSAALDMDMGKTSPDANRVLDGFPPFHADMHLGMNEQPSEEPQHQEEPPRQEPPKDQTPPPSQNESQPPSDDPQSQPPNDGPQSEPQPEPQPASSEPQDHDNSDTVDANVSVDASNPEQVESGIKEVHDEMMHEVKDETKSAIQEVHDMPTEAQTGVASAQGDIHDADERLDQGLAAGVNVSTGDLQKPEQVVDESDMVVALGTPESGDDKDLLDAKVHSARALSASVARRFLNVLGWLA